MYQDIQEFAIRNQEQILIGLSSFLGWAVLLWSKNKAVKWYKGPELTVSKEVEEILKILQERRQEIITCEEIGLAPYTLNWPKLLYIEVEDYARFNKLETFNPHSRINMNRKEKGILRTLLTELYQERVALNKETALQNMKYAPIEDSQREQYYPPKQFYHGDLVTPKSGGPVMTVTETQQEKGQNWVVGSWYDKENKFHSTLNSEEFLKRYEPETKNILPTGGIVPGNTKQPIKFTIRLSYLSENSVRGGKSYVGVTPNNMFITNEGTINIFYDYGSPSTVRYNINKFFPDAIIEDLTEKPEGMN